MASNKISGRFVAVGMSALFAFSSASIAGKPNTGTPDLGGIGSATASGDRWAVVNSDSSFARGKGVAQVTRGDTATGSYVVRFNRNVTSCMYQATIGLSGISGVENPGEISVVRRVSNANSVYVETRDSGGILADRGFHLYVGCN